MVSDSTGSGVPGVTLVLRNLSSSATRTTQTDDSGKFQIAGVQAGSYSLRAAKESFNTVTVDSFEISVGQTVTQRVSLTLAGVVQKMEVQERADALETDAPTGSVALGGERIEEAPASNRNYLNFVLSAPGVSSSANSNTGRSMAGVRNPSNDSGFVFNGMRPRNNAISIDGVDNRDETTGGNRVAIGLEMVQEFRVSGTSVSADFGGAAGGLVNVVTHTGQNIWHGDVTFFHQNEFLNARNPEAETPGRPRFRRYQPGVSSGGPIQRDKTFFFFAVEQAWEAAQEWPEAPARNVSALNNALASPLFARSGVRKVAAGLFSTGESDTEASIKGSHLLDDRNTISARFAFSRGRVSNDVLAGDNFLDQSARGSSLIKDESIVLGWASVLSPNKVSDLRFQWSQRSAALTPNANGPSYEIPGILTMGQGELLDQNRTERHVEVVESFQWTVGRHLFSAGGSAHGVTFDGRLANRFHGIYVFPDLQAFEAGRPDVAIQAFGNPRTNMDTVPIGFWFQDHWQVGKGVTIEAGLRYDRQWLPRPFPDTNRNIAPRLGMAWHPGSSGWVIRAGAGLFYDRYPLAYLNDAVQKDGVHGFEQYLSGTAAANAFSSAEGGTLALPIPGVAPSLYRPALGFSSTYSEKLTAGVERKIDKDTTISVEYSAVRGIHLPRLRNAALTVPPQYDLEQTARSKYEGVSATINRRISKEMTYLASYNLGSTHDDGSDYDEQPLNPSNTRQDWALSRQHQRHRFSFSGVFEVPAEELQGAPEWLKDGLKRLNLAPVFSWGTGRPLNTLLTSDVYRTGAFPISARPAGFSRNSQMMPRTVSLDLRLMKTIPIKQERAVVQFGVEAFNLFNHTNRLRVSAFYTSTFGGLIEAQNARQVQAMFQIEY